MNAIPDTDLVELTSQASLELLAEQRAEARSKVKAIFQRRNALAGEIKSKENELARLRKKLEAAEARIARLRGGDWSVLDDKAEEAKPD